MTIFARPRSPSVRFAFSSIGRGPEVVRTATVLAGEASDTTRDLFSAT
jgi:hypothetical protein